MLATAADVAARLGRDLTDLEEARTAGLLEEASDLVIGWLGCTPAQPTDGAIVRVVSRMVARVIAGAERGTDEIPDPAVTSFNAVMGPFQLQQQLNGDMTDGEPWMTVKDRMKLRRFRCAGRARAVRTW